MSREVATPKSQSEADHGSFSASSWRNEREVGGGSCARTVLASPRHQDTNREGKAQACRPRQCRWFGKSICLVGFGFFFWGGDSVGCLLPFGWFRCTNISRSAKAQVCWWMKYSQLMGTQILCQDFVIRRLLDFLFFNCRNYSLQLLLSLIYLISFFEVHCVGHRWLAS